MVCTRQAGKITGCRLRWRLRMQWNRLDDSEDLKAINHCLLRDDFVTEEDTGDISV